MINYSLLKLLTGEIIHWSQHETNLLVIADIFNIAADARVNPAHETLHTGSGLCYLTHKKAGSDLTQACLPVYRYLSKRAVKLAMALPSRSILLASICISKTKRG